MSFAFADMEKLLDEAAQQKALVPVGPHFAIILDVEEKYNPAKASYGFNWSLAVSPASPSEAPSLTTKFVTMYHYTYVGRVPADENDPKKPARDAQGRVILTDAANAFSTLSMLRAAGVCGAFDRADVVGKVILVDAYEDTYQPEGGESRTTTKLRNPRVAVIGGVKTPVLDEIASNLKPPSRTGNPGPTTPPSNGPAGGATPPPF